MNDPAAPATVAATRALDLALARGMLVVALFSVVASTARVAQDAAIAWRYGATPVVDAYHLLLSLVNWPAAVALAMLTLLVPATEAALHRKAGGEAALWRSEMFGWAMLVSALALPLAWWALHLLTASGLVGLQAHAAALAVSGVPLIVMAVPLGLMGAVLSAWLIASGRHVLTLLEALPPLVMMMLVFASSGLVLFWGTATGIAVQLLTMAYVLHITQGLPKPRLTLDCGEWTALRRSALTLLAGQMLFALTPLVDPFFAARLGEGQIATLSYANRLVLGLLSLVGLGLQRAGLPLLVHVMATTPEQARRIVLRWSAAAALAGLLIGLVIAVSADPLVALIFERGQFTAQSREQVAKLLRYGMLQVPLFLVGLVIVTALASERAIGFLALVTGVGLLTKVACSALLVPVLGVPGLLLATALMYAATALTAWFALVRRLRGVAVDRLTQA